MNLLQFWRNVFLLSSLILGGCATVPSEQVVAEDPWQSYNRAMFNFNAGLDRAVLKPVAKGYRWVMPGFAEKGVSNFFSNLGDIPNTFNNLMQGKLKAAGSDTLRFVMNSTLGLAGLFDVASGAGLEKHEEDFGQTLAVWGTPSGPYMVMPVLGPSTLRDSSGLLVDQAFNPLTYADPEIYWGFRVLGIVDIRTSVLTLEESTGLAIYDDYAQMRDIYLQRRRFLISDGQENGNEEEENELRMELEMLDE